DCVHLVFQYLQEWSLHNLSGQSASKTITMKTPIEQEEMKHSLLLLRVKYVSQSTKSGKIKPLLESSLSNIPYRIISQY
ncbi:unnamed protein product, partial [Bubo scandiacus]